MIEITCAWCGMKKFIAPCYTKNRKNNFCSTACRGKYDSEKKKVDIVCEYCGQTKTVTDYMARGNSTGKPMRFCSHKCSSAHRSKMSNIEGALRRCSVCGQEIPLTVENWGITVKNGLVKFRHPCRLCANKKANIQRMKHRDKVLWRLKEWRKKNLEHRREYAKQYRSTHPEKAKERYVRLKAKSDYRERKKKSDQKYHKAHPGISRSAYIRNRDVILLRKKKENEQLKDWYVRRLIKIATGLDDGDFSPELIEIWRQKVIFRRELKLLNKWRKGNEPNRTIIHG